MLRIAIGAVFGCLLLPLKAQEVVDWSADRPLTWADFQGEAEPWGEHEAYTAYEITSGYSTGPDGKLSFHITCRFLKQGSWVSERGRSSETLLAHERLHFDIAEVNARKLRKRLREVPDRELTKERFLDAVRAVHQHMQEEQERYDRETDHGLNAEQQARWRAQVSEALSR
ncbi:MAG: DUF922 domain-containing protein [Flavobacteriales bacterium]|nr:DUF922 domain-containing protein [Flavobacteriales bacterium]